MSAGDRFYGAMGDISYGQFFWTSYDDDDFEIWTAVEPDESVGNLIFQKFAPTDYLLKWMDEDAEELAGVLSR